MGSAAWGGMNARHSRRVAEVRLKFKNVLREIFRGARVTTKRLHGDLIGSWSATESEIDSVGMQRRKCSELFSNSERRMIREHDAARTQTD